MASADLPINPAKAMAEPLKGSKVRIFVVEDETIVALDLQNSLKVLGYDVVGTASTGAAAISKAISTQPDLVLMDIILQGDMDGIQAAEEIHAQLNIPIIFLTACADEATLQRAKITEPFGYMIKPFEDRELHSHIQIALYRHRMERRLRDSEERYFLATQGANDGLWDWDVQNQKIYFSPRWKSMLGYNDEQVGTSPMEWFSRIHPADKEQVEKKITEHLGGSSSHFESEYRILSASGMYRWVLCRGLARRNEKGKAYRIAGSQTDITDRKVYNPLTGLPNQMLLMDRLERALKRTKGQTTTFGVAVIDVGGVKTIASSFGYVVADHLLCQIAHTIQGCLALNDTVAHFGNDDFVLLLEGVQDGKGAALAAVKLQRALDQPFQIDGQTVYVTAHIGITLRTADYHTHDELIRDAYTAMHRAKDEGKCRFEIFDRKMRFSAVARLKLEADFRRALEQKEFRIHYQPIVDLQTGALAGVEALVRWKRQGGLLYPKDFLMIAESTDLLLALERWVLMESCVTVAGWHHRNNTRITLNVNICPKHYATPELIGELRNSLSVSGLDPRCLRLEITESALMDNTESISTTLAQIQAMNIQLHMDDFGTGYSSLSYLNNYPIDSLKVDQSFVGKLGLSEETWKIVQVIVKLGKSLDMELIAEGVENMIQLRMLQTLKCDYGQGYYFAKPMAPGEIESLLSGPLPWMVAFENPNVRSFPIAAMQ
jgi:diguanylate cyclase (GGDEF)-like protein/PAS domain S-box-containing protein